MDWNRFHADSNQTFHFDAVSNLDSVPDSDPDPDPTSSYTHLKHHNFLLLFAAVPVSIVLSFSSVS